MASGKQEAASRANGGGPLASDAGLAHGTILRFRFQIFCATRTRHVQQIKVPEEQP